MQLRSGIFGSLSKLWNSFWGQLSFKAQISVKTYKRNVLANVFFVIKLSLVAKAPFEANLFFSAQNSVRSQVSLVT